MNEKFYIQSKNIREKIRKKIYLSLSKTPNKKLRDIILQRNTTSSFLKGIMAYYVYEGLEGNFSEEKKIDLASGIEIFCSVGAIFDNAMDNHEQRNEKTTYLKEYGREMQFAASQYVLHYGLKFLLPFLEGFSKDFPNFYRGDEAVIGMIKTDLERSKNLYDQIKTIELSNGIFNETPLVIAAANATKDKNKIELVRQYGFNLGTGLGIYEELRDLLGEHGRKRATEIEKGRAIIPLHYASKLDREFNFNSYLNNSLSEKDYVFLIKKLNFCGAIGNTVSLAKDYLDKAHNSLEKAVNQTCVDKLRPLSDSIKDSLKKLSIKADLI